MGAPGGVLGAAPGSAAGVTGGGTVFTDMMVARPGPPPQEVRGKFRVSSGGCLIAGGVFCGQAEAMNEHDYLNPAPDPAPTADPNLASEGDRFFNSIRRSGLFRSQERWVGGVAGGIAAKFGWDPLLVRGVMFLSFFLSGLGLVAYGVAWALLPEQSDGRIHLQQAMRGNFDVALVGAGIAAIVGMTRGDGVFGFVGGIFSLFWRLTWGAMWIVVILAIIYVLRQRRRNVPPVGAPYTPTGGAAPVPFADAAGANSDGAVAMPAVAVDMPSDGVTAPVGSGAASDLTDSASIKADTARAIAETRAETARLKAETARAVAEARAEAARIKAEAQAHAAQQRAAALAATPVTKGASGATVGAVFGLMFLTGALLAAASRTNFRFPAPWDGRFSAGLLWVGISLVVVGIGIALSGIRGRSAGFLGFLAIVGLVVGVPWTLASSGSHVVTGTALVGEWDNWPGVDHALTVSDGVHYARSIEEAAAGFSTTFGSPTIDLTDLDFSAVTSGDPVVVPIQIRAGDVNVILPRDIAVMADVRLLAGQVQWEVDGTTGTRSGLTTSIARFVSDDAADDGAVLHLMIDAGAGNVTITDHSVSARRGGPRGN